MTADQHNRRQCILPGEITALPQITHFLDGLASDWGFPERLVLSLNLVLEEAFTNIVNYGLEGTEGQAVILDFEKHPERLIIHITDEGKAFDPTLREEPDIALPAEERPIGGLGIFLIRKMMDQVSYERKEGKNILRLEKQW
jgi:serine/threonine-protein kinase RsbW